MAFPITHIVLTGLFIFALSPTKVLAEPISQTNSERSLESTQTTQAPSIESYFGTVQQITETQHFENNNIYQKILVRLSNEKTVEVINDSRNTGKIQEYSVGNKVVVQKVSIGQQGNDTYIITDYNRTSFLLFILIAFSVLSVLVGKKYGIYALLAMAFSFFVIFKFILPQISAGRDPLLITILASLIIVPVAFYLSHGFNKKTHIAIVSTGVTLIVTGILTAISVNLARLTGYGTEEAMFLQVANQNINMKGILLSGIIIGFLGVLDDVTVSQSSIVTQLKKENPDLGTIDLYNKAMEVGRDHITSMINTLVLVYTGASLPLLLLFKNNPQPANFVINSEIIADEVVRTLLGSIGLILAVPLTTFLASIVVESE